MKKKYFIIIYCSVVISLVCCGLEKKQQSLNSGLLTDKIDGISNNSTLDSLVVESTVNGISIVDSLKIDTIITKHDTLSILCWAKFIIYPMGQYDDITLMQKKYSYMKLINEQIPYNDDTTYLVDVYRLRYKSDYVKFLNDYPDDHLQYIYGVISQKDVILVNNIHVGMSFSEFWQCLGIEIKVMEKINVIELECDLNGYWQYYTFKNDTLQRICFDSKSKFLNKE